MQNLNRDTIIKDVSGKPMRAMDIFSISIKHFKHCLVWQIASKFAEGQIGENDIEFVLTVPSILGGEAILFFREAAIKVSYIKHHT